jgi:ABC-type oligopeptide transport system substrate-binding subunit
MTGPVTDRTVIQVSRPVYDQLTAIQRQRQDRLKRKVSYTEIIEDLLDAAEEAS